MTTKNDVTGDNLVTKETTDAYREGWDRIFGKQKDSDEPLLMPVDEKSLRCSELTRSLMGGKKRKCVK